MLKDADSSWDFKYPGSSEHSTTSVDSQHNYGSSRKCSNPGSNNRAFDEVILVQCCLEVIRHILVSEGVVSALLCLMRKLASGLLIGSIRKWGGPYFKCQVCLCKSFLGNCKCRHKESPVVLEKVAESLCCDINCAFPYNQDHAHVLRLFQNTTTWAYWIVLICKAQWYLRTDSKFNNIYNIYLFKRILIWQL